MTSYAGPADAPTPAPATWRSWRSAWVDAAYGAGGFWSRESPGDHFSTGATTGTLVGRAVARFVVPAGQLVVDVGAGDGGLLSALVDLLPGVALVGVDRRARPAGLDPRVGWASDHWDVDREVWTAGGPEAWCGDVPAPLLVAHEWLDDLPVPVVRRGPDGWREVEVDPVGRERLGGVLGRADEAWLARWWREGPRAEVGRSRDRAWTGLVRAAIARGGRALAVDYGHRAGRRPPGGTLTAYARGRQRTPVPDGTANLTAAVAVDAVAAAGEAAGAATLLLDSQADVLGRLPAPSDASDPLEALVRRSERSALTSPRHWGALWWLLQGLPAATS